MRVVEPRTVEAHPTVYHGVAGIAGVLRGDVTLVVNGVKVNEGKTGNLTKGRIALQSEGAEIHFKDVVIKSLK